VTRTGWIGEDPVEVPMPLTEMMLGRQQRRAGPLETALARSRADDARAARDEAAFAPDPDERAANLIARGYTPGLASQLAQRLGDTMAEIEAENAKIEKGKRQQEHLHRAHAAGQITAWDIVRGQDFDEGDPGRVEMLQRRAVSLRAQIADAAQAMSPPERPVPGPVEAAAQRAQQILARVAEEQRLKDQADAQARAQLERERNAFYAARGRRPFASRGAGRSTEPTGPRATRAARRLEDYGYGESTPDRCPPCSDCGYVACRCGQPGLRKHPRASAVA
jgi:hypothetical protein